MRRKYQPTEADFNDEEEDDATAAPKHENGNNRYSLADFVKSGNSTPVCIPASVSLLMLTFEPQPKESPLTANAGNLPVSLSLTVSECIDAATSNIELLSQLPPDFPETQDIKDTCKQIQGLISRYPP